MLFMWFILFSFFFLSILKFPPIKLVVLLEFVFFLIIFFLLIFNITSQEDILFLMIFSATESVFLFSFVMNFSKFL